MKDKQVWGITAADLQARARVWVRELNGADICGTKSPAKTSIWCRAAALRCNHSMKFKLYGFPLVPVSKRVTSSVIYSVESNRVKLTFVTEFYMKLHCWLAGVWSPAVVGHKTLIVCCLSTSIFFIFIIFLFPSTPHLTILLIFPLCQTNSACSFCLSPNLTSSLLAHFGA